MTALPRAISLDTDTSVFYLTLPSSQIVLFQAIIESYEGLGTVRTIDTAAQLIAVITPKSQVDDCQRLLAGLKKDVPWECAADAVGSARLDTVLEER